MGDRTVPNQNDVKMWLKSKIGQSKRYQLLASIWSLILKDPIKRFRISNVPSVSSFLAQKQMLKIQKSTQKSLNQ